jgi:hypothetical protein
VRPPRRRERADGAPAPELAPKDRLAVFREQDWLEPVEGETPADRSGERYLPSWARARWRNARRAAGLPDIGPRTGRPARYGHLRPTPPEEGSGWV